MSVATGLAGGLALSEAREAAGRAFAQAGPPARTVETWRRMDYRRWALERWSPGGGLPPRPAALDPALAARGVVLSTIEEALASHPRLVEPTLRLGLASRDFAQMEAANLAGFAGGAFLYVPPGVKADKPFELRFGQDGAAYDFPRSLIVLGDGAEATVVEEHGGGAQAPAGASSVAFSSIVAGRDSQLRYFYLENLPLGTSHFWHQHAALDRGALLRHYSLLMGASFQKSQLDVELEGEGSRSELYGLLFGSGDQFFDPHTAQLHRAAHTSSDLLFKVALQERARSIYTGDIRIEKEAVDTNAFQQNNNLLLSDTARADTTLVLEILTDQVHCKHGATMGPVSEEELFYLGCRGLDPKEAAKMLVMGFFEPILKDVPLERLKARLPEDIERRLVL